MTNPLCPHHGQPAAQPCGPTPSRPGWRALLALCLGVAALLLPRGFAEETPAANAPATEAPAPGPLCFTAESDDVTVTLQGRDPAKISLEISTDGASWQEWPAPREAKLAHKGDRLFVRAVAANQTLRDHKFQISGKAAASGSVMSLLDRDDQLRSLAGRGRAFLQLFASCKGLTAAPALPATELSESCYAGMFVDCPELATAPELPATTLAPNCYNAMFARCPKLATAPQLPATTLAKGCYRDMFVLDSGLTAAPALPATTLAEECYYSMFAGCRNLTAAPALPATTLAKDCYRIMFINCSKLAAAPKIPANATGLKESGHETMLGGGMALPKGAKAETIAPKDLKKAKIMKIH